MSGYFAESEIGSVHHTEVGKDAEDLGYLYRLLEAKPPLPAHPTAAATEMMAVACDNEPGLRDWPRRRRCSSQKPGASPADLARCRALQA